MEEKNKRKKLNMLWLFIPELFCIPAAVGFTFLFPGFSGDELMHSLECAVIALICVGTASSRIRGLFFREGSDRMSAGAFRNYWIGFACCLGISAICVFLPAECWPFVPVFVLLSLFGEIPSGCILSILAMMLPAVLTGRLDALLVYIPAGVLAVSFFCPINTEMKVVFPLSICLAALFVLETAVFVITREERPALEMFLMPAVNLVITTIFLIGIVRLYSRSVLYRFRDKYLEINDTECTLMARLKKEDKAAYKKSIHVTHFCEMIAMNLGYDTDAVKCAGYYHVFGDQLEEIMEEHRFPPEAVRILTEYLNVKRNMKKGSLKTKETAVLICAETVIDAVIQLLEKDPGKSYDFDKVIGAIFQRFDETGFFSECDIPVRDLGIVEKTFREGKLYYDFLR